MAAIAASQFEVCLVRICLASFVRYTGVDAGWITLQAERRLTRHRVPPNESGYGSVKPAICGP